MLRKLFNLVPVLLVVSLVSIGTSQEKKKNVDVSGTWRYEYELDGRTLKDSLMLNVEKDGQVTGTYKGVADNVIEVKSGKIDGDELTLEVALDYQGTAVKVNYKGKVKGDELEGNVVAVHSEGELEFDWKAKRSVEASDVSGMWELEIDAGDRVLEPVLELALEGSDLKGTYKDANSGISINVEKARVEKNNLKFTINAKLDNADIKADFSGRPYGNKISGTVEYNLGGDSGVVEFKGKRKAAKKPEPAK